MAAVVTAKVTGLSTAISRHSTSAGTSEGPMLRRTEPIDAWLGETDRRSPNYICWVQRSLNRIVAARLVEDGRIGPRTQDAVRTFQRRQGLAADGVVGPQTERALIAA